MNSNMKVFKDKILYFAILVIAGISLSIAGFTCANDYVKGIGIGLAVVGVLKIAQYLLISRDPEKVKRYKIANNDDRLKSLTQKAGQLTLFITVIAGLIAVAGFGLAGMQTVSLIISLVVCAQTLVYTGVYYVLQHKY